MTEREEQPLTGRAKTLGEQAQRLTGHEQAIMMAIQAHVIAETVTASVDETMATMSGNPYLYYNTTAVAAVGREAVRHFYATQLVGQYLPPDGEMTTVSLIVSGATVVGEVVFRFTHTMQMNWLAPGIPPTGKSVELVVVAFATTKDGKIANERVYWDNASLLYQLGLLEKGDLPICGAESARKLLAVTDLAQE